MAFETPLGGAACWLGSGSIGFGIGDSVRWLGSGSIGFGIGDSVSWLGSAIGPDTGSASPASWLGGSTAASRGSRFTRSGVSKSITTLVAGATALASHGWVSKQSDRTAPPKGFESSIGGFTTEPQHRHEVWIIDQ